MSEFVRQISIAIESDLDPDAAALDFAKRARANLEEEIAAKRAPAKYRQYVDGREGVAFEAVRPGGSIVAEFLVMPEAAEFALAFLRARSPASAPRAGADRRAFKHPFRDSFWAAIGGRWFAPGEFNPAYITSDEELQIGNMQPYNRKVDVQLAGGLELHFSVPAGLYEAAAVAVNRAFGNRLEARRRWNVGFDFPGRYALKQTQIRKGTAGRVRRWSGDMIETPILVISPR